MRARTLGPRSVSAFGRVRKKKEGHSPSFFFLGAALKVTETGAASRFRVYFFGTGRF